MLRTLICLSLLVALGSLALAEEKNAVYLKGQIVKVNADGNTITLRIGTGNQAKELELKCAATTKFFGADKQAVNEGLKNKGFKEGSDVWFRMGAGADKDTIADMRLYDPAQK